MNINFRKSIRRPSRSSKFYLESFEMFDRTFKHLSLDDVSRYSSSLPVIDFRENELMIPIKPLPAVIKYELNSERSKGMIGQIVLTNFRMKFIPYSHDKSESKKRLQNHQNGKALSTSSDNYKEESDLNGDKQNSFLYPPFDLIVTNESKTDEDIEFINILDLVSQQNLLQVFCFDFRCIEFQFKSANQVKGLMDQLDKLIIKPNGYNSIGQLSQNLSPSMSALNTNSIRNSINTIAADRDFELSYFWTVIALQYPFNYPKEWEAHDGYWYLTNSQLRISQANENYQLCKSLPASFITLKCYLTDINLLQNISAKMKGQRVPVITYSHKCRIVLNKQPTHKRVHRQIEKNNMLIRSGIMSKEVSDSLSRTIIDDLKSKLHIEINDLPDVQSFVSTFRKLREACILNTNTTHFFSQIGKWMKLVCKILKTVSNLSKTLEEDSSVLLMENNDNHWNILLSCLIQITLDKNRRTIEGFNSLLSKEWIYLVGLPSSKRLDHSKLPNQILFTLLLDCVYQMLIQNSSDFEFTSLYLIRCFDLSFMPFTAFVKSNNNLDNDSCFESDQQTNSEPPINKHSFNRQSMRQSSVQFSRLSSSTNNSFNFNSNYTSYLHYSKQNNSTLSPLLMNLSVTQTLFFFNPFYNKAKQKNSRLQISFGILSVQFWRPLYLRWSKPFRTLNYYNQFHFFEYIYFKELISSDTEFNSKQIVHLNENSDDHLSNSIPINNNVSDDGLDDSFEHF